MTTGLSDKQPDETVTDWRDDPLTVATARLVAAVIIGLRLKTILRWMADRLPK